MIILDTNALSALMHQQPNPQAVAWSDDQSAESIWLSSIALFEVRYGLALLPAGRRKDLLEQRFEELVQDDLQNRMLFFDTDAAARAANLTADGKPRGSPVDMRDTLIAGIALACRATLATRNMRIFDDLSVPVANPWADA